MPHFEILGVAFLDIFWKFLMNSYFALRRNTYLKASCSTLALLSVVGLCFTYYHIFWRESRGELRSDLLAHIGFIDTRLDKIVHPLFHWSVKALSEQLSLSYIDASIYVLMFYSGLSMACFFYIFYSKLKGLYSVPTMVVATVSLMAIAAVWVPWFSENIYLGVGTPNVMHNPTAIVAKPFAFIVLILYFNMVVEAKEKRLFYYSLACSIVCVLSILAKPNFALAAIFSLPLWMLYCLRRDGWSGWFRLLCLMAPVLVMVFCLGCQYLSKYGGVGAPDHVVIDFLGVARLRSSSALFSIFLLSAFPFLFVVFFPRALKNRMITLALSVFVVACAQFFILAESGIDYAAGNFGWGRQILAPFLFAACFAEFLAIWRAKPNKLEKMKLYIVGFVYCCHLVSGLIYFDELLTSNTYF